MLGTMGDHREGDGTGIPLKNLTDFRAYTVRVVQVPNGEPRHIFLIMVIKNKFKHERNI